MGNRIASKIKLASVDELLGVPEIAGTVDIDVNRISSFANHPFKVLDDEKMASLVESVELNGVLNPVIVRPDTTGNYEMVSGHRRLHAAKLAGLTKVPAIVKEMSDDEATIVMVDSNIQREELLPSEKAFAFKMKMEAMKRQGTRNDLTSCHYGTKFRSDKLLSEQTGESARSIQRYIRLTELIPDLLDLVDQKKVQFTLAVDISFFNKNIQQWIYEYVTENKFLTPKQIAALRSVERPDDLTQADVINIMNGVLPEHQASKKLSLSERKLDPYFPPEYTARDREDVIIALLKQWAENREQD